MNTLQEIALAVQKASNAINDSEQLLTPSLAVKAKKAAEQYPYDQSLVVTAQVLNQMSDNKPFISRAEFKSIFNKFDSYNSKLKEVFAEELQKEELKGPTVYNREGESGVDDYEVVADPVLSNALAGLFDGSNEHRVYSAETARKAEKICNAGLMEVGVVPNKISVFAGQEDIILCRADYQTPKGMTPVVIPVEIKEGAALIPNMFLGVNSFVDLNKDLLEGHIKATAGKSYHVDGENILKVLSTAKHGVKKVASDIELAVIAMNTDKQQYVDPNGILGMRPIEEVAELKDPEVEKSAEHFEFADRVTSKEGAARFIFNDRVVKAGRDIILRKMAEFGYPNTQVKVESCDERKINYAVGVGVNAAMIAPVEVQGNNVFPPKIAIASGKIKSFSKDGVRELVNETAPDKRALAASSMSAGLKPTELVAQVKEAVLEGNLIKAEDAINVLGEIDKEAQKVAIAILMRGLSSPEEPGNQSADILAQAFDVPGVNSSNDMVSLGEKQVRDVPLFNSYNVFFPEE